MLDSVNSCSWESEGDGKHVLEGQKQDKPPNLFGRMVDMLELFLGVLVRGADVEGKSIDAGFLGGFHVVFPLI